MQSSDLQCRPKRVERPLEFKLKGNFKIKWIAANLNKLIKIAFRE